MVLQCMDMTLFLHKYTAYQVELKHYQVELKHY